MHRVAVLALMLGACKPNPPPGATWIAPLDGQTDVGVDAALRVVVEQLQLPTDYPLPDDFLRVVDLDGDGTFLPGVVSLVEVSGTEATEIRFTMDGGWQPAKRYAWSIGELPALDRAPEFNLPEAAYGEAVFGTTGDLDVLDVAVETSGRVCALLSRQIAEAGGPVTATLDDAPVELGAIDLQPESAFLDGEPIAEDGVTVACFGDLEVTAGSSLRLWWGDAGPWRVTLDDRTIRDVILARRSPR